MCVSIAAAMKLHAHLTKPRLLSRFLLFFEVDGRGVLNTSRCYCSNQYCNNLYQNSLVMDLVLCELHAETYVLFFLRFGFSSRRHRPNNTKEEKMMTVLALFLTFRNRIL